jgi:hypothetical protein
MLSLNQSQDAWSPLPSHQSIQSIDTCNLHPRLLGMMNPQLSRNVNIVARYIVSSAPFFVMMTYRSSWMGSWARGEFERSMPIPASLPVSSAPLLYFSSKEMVKVGESNTHKSNSILLGPKSHCRSLHVIGRTCPSHQWILPSSSSL